MASSSQIENHPEKNILLLVVEVSLVMQTLWLNTKLDNMSKDLKSCDDRPSEGSRNVFVAVNNRGNVQAQAERSEKRFICEYCSKEFNKGSNFKSHLMIHSGEKPHSCSFCDKRFPQKSRLKKHLRVHSGEKPHKCTVCQKCFSHSHQLRGHMRTHSGERPYVCRLCGRTFRQSGHLKGHIKSHLGKESLPYENTSKFFMYSKNSQINPTAPFCQSYLVNQTSNEDKSQDSLEKVDNQIVPVRYPCGLCEKTFSQMCNLKAHQRVHTKEKPYKCTDCGKAFAYSHGLTDHKRTHTGIRPYFCDYCDKSFTQIGNLQKHVRIHNDERPYSCSRCNKAFRQLNHLKNHQGVHALEDLFKCDTCGKSYKSSQALKLHVVSHTEKSYSCISCLKRFSNENSLNGHECSVIDMKLPRVKKKTNVIKEVTVVIKGVLDIKDDDEGIGEENIVFSEDKVVKNKEVRKVLRKTGIENVTDCKVDEINSDKDLSIGVEIVNVEDVLDLKEDDLVIKKELDVEEDNSCETAALVNFDNSDDEPLAKKKIVNKNIVRKTRSEKGFYPCGICNKIYPYKYTLKSHMKIHSDHRDYVCEVCGRTFVYAHNLEDHKRTHSGDKPFKCSYCDKRFTQLNHVQKHIRTHTGERPFSCEICGRLFSQSKSFKAHHRSHAGHKDYGCTICDKKFSQKISLKKHLENHAKKDIPLSVVEASLVMQTARLKENDKPSRGPDGFYCDLCDRSFTKVSYFKVHVRIHTGDKPYNCCKCDYKCTQSSSLKRHMKVHGDVEITLSPDKG